MIKVKGSKFRQRFLNTQTAQELVENLDTCRSCPTGFYEGELKNTSTIELLHLRKSIYDYLNHKSTKTRNVQFIYLLKRINKELTKRNVKLPYFVLLSKELSMQLQPIIEKEHIYLMKKRKLMNFENLDGFDFSLVISNQNFSVVCNMPNIPGIPDFLNDKDCELNTDLSLFNSRASANTPESSDFIKDDCFELDLIEINHFDLSMDGNGLVFEPVH